MEASFEKMKISAGWSVKPSRSCPQAPGEDFSFALDLLENH
jgi:hypothetical protein